jgi:O-antigen/teichoic acid export membrane protein
LNALRLPALFLSKSGAMLVGILFLPIYHRMMGDAFGLVAIILALQAFAAVCDFGLSTLLSRDAAQLGPASAEAKATWHRAEQAATIIYSGLAVVAAIGSVMPGSTLSPWVAVGTVMLLWSSVTQNIAQAGLMAHGRFLSASGLQISGVLLRAAATVAALHLLSPDLQTFISAQVAATAVFLVFTRQRLQRSFELPAHAESSRRWSTVEVRRLLVRGLPLMWTGLAGAAVLQLDKPIVSAFVTPREVSHYFLAMTVAALPAALLSGPLSQYFQPRLIRLMDSPASEEVRRIVRRFTLSLVVVVAVPSWVLWEWADPIVRLWLHGAEGSQVVAAHLRTLLPAFSMGAICSVPVVLLLAAQDFRYQAVTSVWMSLSTLALVLWCASVRRVDLVCWAYVFYFGCASLSVWFRALSLERTQALARRSFSVWLGLLSLLAALWGALRWARTAFAF